MNCIFCAIATIDGKFNKKANCMFQNAFVSLFSAKAFNKDIDVVLVTNIKDTPIFFKNLFDKNNIKIIYVYFDKYVFPDNVPWKLAYYKICALDYIANTQYENIIMIDVDTIFIRPITQLIDDCDNVMLYLCEYPLSHRDRATYLDEIKRFFSDERKLLYYGGEFVAGSSKHIKKFLIECEKVYSKLIEKNVYSQRGDEFIWSYAAKKIDIKIANAYVNRLWTGKNYETSNLSWWYDVVILHLPREKEMGLYWTYKYILKFNKIPDSRKLLKQLGVPPKFRKINIVSCINYIKKVIK